MQFVSRIMVHKSISGHPPAAGMSQQQGGRIRDLLTIFFKTNKWNFCFTTIMLFFSKYLDIMENVMGCGYSKTNFCYFIQYLLYLQSIFLKILNYCYYWLYSINCPPLLLRRNMVHLRLNEFQKKKKIKNIFFKKFLFKKNILYLINDKKDMILSLSILLLPY